MLWLWIVNSWALLIYMSWRCYRHYQERKHIRMFKEALSEELKALQAESLATPGGFNNASMAEPADAVASKATGKP